MLKPSIKSQNLSVIKSGETLGKICSRLWKGYRVEEHIFITHKWVNVFHLKFIEKTFTIQNVKREKSILEMVIDCNVQFMRATWWVPVLFAQYLSIWEALSWLLRTGKKWTITLHNGSYQHHLTWLLVPSEKWKQ